MRFAAQDIIKGYTLFAVGFVEDLHTGDVSTPGRSRAAAPLDDEHGIFVKIAQGDLVEACIVNLEVGDHLA
jgi:hypothetical protein